MKFGVILNLFTFPNPFPMRMNHKPYAVTVMLTVFIDRHKHLLLPLKSSCLRVNSHCSLNTGTVIYMGYTAAGKLKHCSHKMY